MANVLICALGAGRDKSKISYWSIRYQFEKSTTGTDLGAEDAETPFVTEWLVNNLTPKPEKVVVLLTNDAKEHANWLGEPAAESRDVPPSQGLLDRLTAQGYNEGTTLVPVDIPVGRNDAEMWAMFNTITGAVMEGDTLTLDITNAFRSLGHLVLMAASFLRRAKSGVTLQAVYYGALEARADETSPTPVFSLSPFLPLFDWAEAVEAFERTGEATLVAALLTSIQSSYYRSRPQNSTRENAPALKGLASHLESLSLALDLVRPMDVLQLAADLPALLDKTQQNLANFAPPFALVFNSVKAQYSAFGQAKPLEKANTDGTMTAMLYLIDWYVTHNRYLAAWLLAREWLVSWVLYRRGERAPTLFTRGNAREDVTNRMNTLTRGQVRTLRDTLSDLLGENMTVTINISHNDVDILKTWDSILDLRNDLAHCGFRDEPGSPISLRDKVKQVRDDLFKLTGEGVPAD